MRPGSILAGRMLRFEVPDDILAAWREAGRRSLPEYDAWRGRIAALSPGSAACSIASGRAGLPDGWEEPLRTFRERAAKEQRPNHGIKLSGDIVDLLADAIPELISGAPDLEGATKHKRQARAIYGRRTMVAAMSITASASTPWAR